MTTTTGAPARRYVAPSHQLTFAGLLRGELIKLRTTRSLVTLLIVTVVCAAGISIPVALTAEPHTGPAKEALPMFVTTSILGMQLAIFLVAALSAVAGANEFGNGTIRVTFAAAPRRTPVLAAKLIVVAGAATALVTVTIMVTSVVTWLSITPGQLWTPVTNAESLLGLAGAVIATAGVSVSAVSLGCLLRSSAGAIFAILGLLIVVTIILLAIPPRVLPPGFSDYSFGGAVTGLLGPVTSTGKWVVSVLALVVWSAAFATGAAASMRRRDA
ncbi:ABC transporter permease [Longispora albida]|uniref:ABC transporter permease n=1 Tax=Longispora albida TaxID=203523 RepID=UPI0012FC130C|nr:ABC transporter permease [Longispora albida]